MSHLNVDWFITHEGKPVIEVSDPWPRSRMLLTPTFARILAADILKAAEESERPDAAQVCAERAP